MPRLSNAPGSIRVLHASTSKKQKRDKRLPGGRRAPRRAVLPAMLSRGEEAGIHESPDMLRCPTGSRPARCAPNGLDAQPGGMFHAVVRFVNCRYPVPEKSGPQGAGVNSLPCGTALFPQSNDQELAGRLRTAPWHAQIEHLVLRIRRAERPN